MVKLLKESRYSVRFMIPESMFKELYDHLKEKKIYIDEFTFKDNIISGEINNGDWKHEHLHAVHTIANFFGDRGIHVEHDQWTTGSDGSDCYSAKHVWRLFSKNTDLEPDEPIELELQEPKYIKENTADSLSNASATTVEDILAGMIGNSSDSDIDRSLQIFTRIAKALGVSDYTDLQVLIHDGDYDLKSFDTLFTFSKDIYKTRDVKLFIIDEKDSDAFKAVQEVLPGGSYFIYAKDMLTLDHIVQAVEKYNNGDNCFEESIESKDMYCVYFEQDGYEQLEFTGTIDECNKYISDIQAEQYAEFGEEAPERFIKPLGESIESKYIDREVAEKTNNQKIKDAYDRNELSILVRGDVWYTERCPKGLAKELKAEMKRLYPDLRHLYGESLKIFETTQRQLDNREKTLYNNIRNRLGTNDLMGTREQWTDAEKREYSEIRCISMIHSILTYAYRHDYTVDYVMKNRYMKRYIDELGEDRVKVLIAEEIEEFTKATVKFGGTDSEGVSYNQVIFDESSDSSNYDNMEVYVPGDDIPANWYSKKSYQDFINQDPDKTKDWIDFNMLVNEWIPDEIRPNINNPFNLDSDEWEMLADKYPNQFRNKKEPVTEEMTDLVHDEWEQPDVDVAVFVKGEYQIKKLSDDDADKEEWEVMHFKGDTNEGTSMGKYDNLDAAKKKADDDAKKSEPKMVNENFITEPTVGKLYYFTKNNNIHSGIFRRKTPSWYFFDDEIGNEIPVSIFTSISDIREELETLLGVVDKLEKDTKTPMTVPNRWTRVPNQHGKPLGESSNAGLKIYAKNIKVGDKFVSTKAAVDEYMPHKTFTITDIEDIGKDELMIKFISDEGEERDKIVDVTELIGFVPKSDITESTDDEYETRKSNYLKAKADFEKYGEENNNDVLSREERMLIAKAEFEKVGGSINEEYDPKDTEFNDKYFPRVDLNDDNIHYYKLDGSEYAYDMKNAVVMFLFKDEDEVEHFGIKDAPYRVLDTVGLSRDNWNDKPERDEYLRGYKQDLDSETSYLVRDFIQNELPYYQKGEN